MGSIEIEIHDAIIDATVTDLRTGEEVLDVSTCYLALCQALECTLPESAQLGVEWGPCATRRKAAVESAPAWVWEAALRGELVLVNGCVRDGNVEQVVSL